ncbi:MAG: hypothetical protein ACK5QW_10285, partial [Cyanobacteriota bacterium]
MALPTTPVRLRFYTMGNFSGLSDDDAELLTGGAVSKPSTAYNGSNYGQFKQSGGTGANHHRPGLAWRHHLYSLEWRFILLSGDTDGSVF